MYTLDEFLKDLTDGFDNFSTPKHKVLMVSYCDRSLSGVRCKS